MLRSLMSTLEISGINLILYLNFLIKLYLPSLTLLLGTKIGIFNKRELKKPNEKDDF
jgi:hypothetical protein